MPNASTVTIISEILNFPKVLCLRHHQVDPKKFQRPLQVDPNKSYILVHIFLNYCMGKKEKSEVGAEVWKGVNKNPTQTRSYLCGILSNSFPNFAPDTRPLRLLKVIDRDNIKKSWDKQSESVNV